MAAQLLEQLGLDLKSARQKVMEVIGGSGSPRRTVGSTEAFTVSEIHTALVQIPEMTVTMNMPVCPGCRVSLEGFLKYRILDAQESDGDGVRKVMFLFCANCGVGIDDWMVPE